MKNQTYRMTMLYDFYGELLTERQKEFFDLYYNEDLSLAEIAENAGISRQGVRDVIVRAEAIMTELEDKTGLLKRFMQMRDKLTAIGKGAFEGCKLLGTLTLPGTLSEIGTDAFYGCEQVRLSVGENAYARDWAMRHSIPLSFWESDTLPLLLLCAASAVGALLLWFGWRRFCVWKAKRAANEKASVPVNPKAQPETNTETEENA